MAEVDISSIDEVIDLYRIDLGEFVVARAALAKELRADGRKEEAKAVVKLRKPTVPAWLLDQVAAEQPELIEAALAAGEALATATDETLEGDASNLRGATEAEREASAAVMDAANAHLTLTADHRERIAASLRAAIADDDIRAQLRAGLLAADHEPPAMGFAAEAAQTDGTKAADNKAPAAKGAAKAKLAEPPVEQTRRSKRKIRRVGTPSSAKRQPVDEVDAKRKAKEAERLQAEERKRLQAALDAEANKARANADRLEEKARKAEAVAAAARAEADDATTEAVAAEAAAEAGPPD
ncbi:MAG TPA: hypothetical protein VNQ33_10575 [Acidimicrobiales bacterium]|nr:hypothetical protein [Acidimicrobiales bacterium]